MILNQQTHKNTMDAFINGAKNGMYLAINSTIPNMVMAFSLIQLLNLIGVLNVLEVIFTPFMNVFNLPGAGAAVLVAAFISTGGGIGTAMALFASGILEINHLPITLMGIFILGAQVQFIGRIIGTAGVSSKYVPQIILTNVILSFVGMYLMKWIVILYS